MNTLTKQQRHALELLVVAPALMNKQGAPLGISKHHDGSTLNGNLRTSLFKLGFIACTNTGEERMSLDRQSGSRFVCKVHQYTITDAGRAALEAA